MVRSDSNHYQPLVFRVMDSATATATGTDAGKQVEGMGATAPAWTPLLQPWRRETAPRALKYKKSKVDGARNAVEESA